jgi:hypothetical protein
MNTRARPRYTLLEFSKVEIGGKLWQEYQELGEPLSTYPFAKSGSLVEGQSLSDIPYDNPSAAAQALRRSSLLRTFSHKIAEM